MKNQKIILVISISVVLLSACRSVHKEDPNMKDLIKQEITLPDNGIIRLIVSLSKKDSVHHIILETDAKNGTLWCLREKMHFPGDYNHDEFVDSYTDSIVIKSTGCMTSDHQYYDFTVAESSGYSSWKPLEHDVIVDVFVRTNTNTLLPIAKVEFSIDHLSEPPKIENIFIWEPTRTLKKIN